MATHSRLFLYPLRMDVLRASSLAGPPGARLFQSAPFQGGSYRPLCSSLRRPPQPVVYGRHRGLLARHPALAESSLHTLPKFATQPAKVHVLSDPADFYDTLLSRIRTARRRIFLASLYLGTGAQEKALVEALAEALKREPSLRLVVLLDCLRATREMPRPSGAALVANLSARFPTQVDFRLFHTPTLYGWTKKLVPRRFNEGWGLQHVKVYGFDDAVLISGANLSADYFSNRQDRYILFDANAPLADYFYDLLATLSRLSFVARPVSDSTVDLLWPADNATPKHLFSHLDEDLIRAAHETLTSLTTRWTLPHATPHVAARAAGEPPELALTTTLHPVLQMGLFNIRHESDIAVPHIFRLANALATAPGGATTTLDWTSGYFSLSTAYLSRIHDCRAAVRIITASPQANGFYNSRGVSRFIPPAYTYLTKQFYESLSAPVSTRATFPDVSIHEWRREDWTYHAKGIWLTPSFSSLSPFKALSSPIIDPDDTPHRSARDFANGATDRPFLTLVGSSNYGRRSSQRDLEANIYLQTTDEGLRAQLHSEVEGLRAYATDVVDDRLFERSDRKVPWGVKKAVGYIRNML